MAEHPVDELSERQWSLLLETYTHSQHLIVSNEDMGERRFQVLMTVVGAVGIALGLVADTFGVDSLRTTAFLLAVVLTALGYATTMRMARRDVTTSRLKAELQGIRRFVAEGRPELVAVLPLMAEQPAGMRYRPLYPSGGLVDLVALVTSAFAGIAVGAYLGGQVHNLVTVAGVVGAAALAWLAMIVRVRRLYDKEEVLKHSPKATEVKSETFRANVGVVLHDGRGRVLMFERSGESDALQFPQGGIDVGEDRTAAAWRELREETGLTEADVRLERELGRWLSYEIPAQMRSEKTGLGQTQWWFLATVTDPGQLPAVPSGEFVRSEWTSWENAVDRAVDFKRPVYAELARAFAPSSEPGAPR